MNTTLVPQARLRSHLSHHVRHLCDAGVDQRRTREPPETGDGHDYDAIAFNVWQGRGFGYHWSDENWRKPYQGIPRYRLLLTRTV